MTSIDGVHPWVAEHRAKPGFGINTVASGGWSALKEMAQAAEENGFDSLWLPDHPLLGFDSWTQLAALAGATTRIRLGTMVTCVYYRHPVQLARTVADVDRISGGRVILGLGSGDMPWEFQALGFQYPPPAERAAALEETLQVMAPLLRGDQVEFEGSRFNIDGARLQPPAAQQPRIPILIAGGGAKTTLRLTAGYADANNMAAASWAGGAYTPDDVGRKFDALRARAEEAGRPYDSILRTTSTGVILAESEQEKAAMLAAVENDPVRKRLFAFLERIPRFCTKEEAVELISGLHRQGFQYFLLSAQDAKGVERLARQVVDPARAALEAAPA